MTLGDAGGVFRSRGARRRPGRNPPNGLSARCPRDEQLCRAGRPEGSMRKAGATAPNRPTTRVRGGMRAWSSAFRVTGGLCVLRTGHQFLILGGFTAQGVVLTDGASYDPATRTWTPLPAPPPLGMYASAAWTGREMIVPRTHRHRGTDQRLDVDLTIESSPATDDPRRAAQRPWVLRPDRPTWWTSASLPGRQTRRGGAGPNGSSGDRRPHRPSYLGIEVCPPTTQAVRPAVRPKASA